METNEIDDTEKVMKMMKKRCINDVKMDRKSMEIHAIVVTCDFLFFAKIPYLKSDFHKISGAKN